MGQHLSTVEAARILGVTPNELRACEQRYGFPSTIIDAHRRQFLRAEVLSLQAALPSALSVAHAIQIARSTHGPHARPTMSAAGRGRG